MESHLEEFVKVVEAGSVSAAARQLGIPRASVSRRLAKLEDSYGVQLLHRESHRQTLTEAGRELYQRARRIVAAVAEARSAVSQMDGVPRGVLRFGMPGWAAGAMRLAEAFRARYPEVEVEIVTSDAYSDLLAHRIDVALMAGKIHDERLIARRLLTYDTLVYGSPKLLERGPPTLETLADFDCIVGFDANGRPETSWPLRNGGAVSVSGPVRVGTIEGQLEGARLGLGLALLPEGQARQYVDSGELVSVLVGQVGITTPVSLAWPETEFLDPKVRVFVDLVGDMLQQMARERETRS